MQGIESQQLELFALRLHVLLGAVVLALTALRLIWRWMDESPGPLPGLSPLHRRLVGAIHALLYLILGGLSISGLVLLIQSGLGAILLGLSSEPIPANLSEYLPRKAHALEARVYIALLLAHLGGVIVHQLTKGEVMSRMGVRFGQTAEQNRPLQTPRVAREICRQQAIRCVNSLLSASGAEAVQVTPASRVDWKADGVNAARAV
jgi:cytochrome b561